MDNVRQKLAFGELNNFHFHELHKIQGAWQAAQFFNAHALINN
jgi:hypothetical protein